MGIFSSWEGKYCTNVDKGGDAIGLIGVSLDLSLVSADLALEGKELPQDKLRAFQIGFIVGELSKLFDLDNINPSDKLHLINTVIIYWHARLKKIHSEGEAKELIDTYSYGFTEICNDMKQLGFEYSISDCDDNLLIDYFGIRNLESSTGYQIGIKQAENVCARLKKDGEQVGLQTIANISHKYYEEIQGNVIEGFLFKMNEYSDSNEILMFAKDDDDEIFFAHTNHYRK